MSAIVTDRFVDIFVLFRLRGGSNGFASTIKAGQYGHEAGD